MQVNKIPKNLFSLFEIEDSSRKLILCIRFLALVFVVVYVVALFDAAFDWYAYTLRYFIRSLIVFSGYGAIGNFGLFFITTKRAKKMRIFSTICYIPTVFLTPIITAQYVVWSLPIVFFASLIIYWRFNPWRQNE